jgi:hypothetical protein
MPKPNQSRVTKPDHQRASGPARIRLGGKDA